MEFVAALLTAILLGLFWFHFFTTGPRLRARRSAGELLLKLRSGYRPWQILSAVAFGLGLLTYMVLCVEIIFVMWSPMFVFIAAMMVMAIGGWILLLMRSNLEFRRRGIVFEVGARVTMTPWHRIICCRWMSTPGRLFVQAGAGIREFKIHPDRVEAASEMLGRFVELRDASGTILNPETETAHQLAQTDDAPTDDVEPFRMQFGLRTLLLLMLVASSAFSWMGIRMGQIRAEEAVVAALDHVGPKVTRIGGRIWGLDFSGCKSKPTDDDLTHLKELAQLGQLDLSNAPITDAGLAHLKGMTSLEFIYLDDTQITDAGLEHLKTLPRLKDLLISDTRVTDEGVRRFQQALPDVWISH